VEKLSESENERIVRAFFETYNQHEQESMFDDWSEDLEVVTPMMRKLEYDGFKEEMLHERSGFPDAQMTIRNLVSKGNVVAVETDWKGTQMGEYLGRSPTNVTYEAPGAWFFELENGLITRIRYYFNPTLYS
jgi:predicted ester cyclase